MSAGVDRVKDNEEGASSLGVAGEVDDGLGADAEGAFVANHQAGQVVAGIVAGWAAEPDDRSVGHDHLDAQHMIDRHAVFEGVGPARVGADVAANGAGGLAGGVGGVVQSRSGQGAGQPDVDHAGLDDGVAVAVVDLDNPAHPGQADHDPAADG